jgi:hypothetical protein
MWDEMFIKMWSSKHHLEDSVHVLKYLKIGSEELIFQDIYLFKDSSDFKLENRAPSIPIN